MNSEIPEFNFRKKIRQSTPEFKIVQNLTRIEIHKFHSYNLLGIHFFFFLEKSYLRRVELLESWVRS